MTIKNKNINKTSVRCMSVSSSYQLNATLGHDQFVRAFFMQNVRSIQPFNFVSDFIEIKKIREAFSSLYLVTSTELNYFLIKSIYRAMLLV